MCRPEISAWVAGEIGFLFGQYKRLANRVTGIPTGQGLAFGGSQIRTAIPAKSQPLAFFKLMRVFS